LTPAFPLTLDDFRGTWDLERAITDHRAGSTARFVGTAVFSADAEGLAYVETGVLTLPGHPPIQADRRYRWRQDGALIVVDFEDGQPFHHFDPSHPQAAHWCDPDQYDVGYDFACWPRWRSVWTVHGPRKDYQMTNLYQPAAE